MFENLLFLILFTISVFCFYAYSQGTWIMEYILGYCKNKCKHTKLLYFIKILVDIGLISMFLIGLMTALMSVSTFAIIILT